jgi:hypothetical protein
LKFDSSQMGLRLAYGLFWLTYNAVLGVFLSVKVRYEPAIDSFGNMYRW